MVKIKMLQCFNGKFPECPNCGKPMAKGSDMTNWWCISGCGLKIDNVRELVRLGDIKIEG